MADRLGVVGRLAELFLGLFRVFFFVCFLCVFLEALGRPFGAIGSLWGPFEDHLGLILVTFSG